MDEATRPERTASASASASAGLPDDERGAPAELRTRLAELSDWRLIGRGGFAAVYAARQTRLGRTVAVKLLNDRPSPHALRAFMRECELLGRLSSHPNIVTVFDAGVTGGDRPFLVMEHLAQGTLAQRIADGGRVDVPEIVRVAQSIASALTTAHRRGVLHLDVKPANVMLDDDGAPVLGDFGVARLEVGGTIGTGGVPFSPFYAAPEVLDGQRPTRATDVYGLGATLFTMIAGRPPFWSDDDNQPSAVIARTLRGALPDLSTRGVPIELITLVESMLDRRPESRPTLDDLTARFEALAHGSSLPVAPSSVPPTPAVPPPASLDPGSATTSLPNRPREVLAVPRPSRLKPSVPVLLAIAVGVVIIGVAATLVAVSSKRTRDVHEPTTAAGRGSDSSRTTIPATAVTTGPPGSVTVAFPDITGVAWDSAVDTTLLRSMPSRSAGDITDARARTLTRAGKDRALVLRITLAATTGVVDQATFNDYVIAHFVPSAKPVTVRSTVVLRARAKGTSVAVFRAPDGVGWFVAASSNGVVDAETAALVGAVGG
jgi:serine/threonine protein kinase